jgi:tripartite ATP-independent transporter DctP family solute receptor
MRFKTIAAAFIAAAALAMAPAHEGRAQQAKVLKFASIQATGQPSYKGMQRMAEIIEKKTNGAYKLQLFADSQLGTEQESAEGVQFGTIDMYMGSSGAVGRFLPSLEAFSAPFIWRDVDHMMKVVRGPIGEELNQELVKKTGIRILDMGWFFGARHIATKGFSVNTPADLKGRKIRMQPTTIYIEQMRAMGANVQSLDWKEVYTSMQTGVIEGFDSPVNVLAARSMWEVLDNLSLTSHILQNMVVIINEGLFKSMTPEVQKIFIDAAKEAGDYQTDLTIKGDEAAIDAMKQHNVKVITPDVAAFRAATANVYKQFESKWAPNLYQRIVDTR